ncbi:MAG: type IV secretion system protein [Acidobacteriota bacterium]|nr:type IV secretion system protein [Acidobacteriota bacterium]MDE3265432.1 type IV secretion system protein [Acidobacteriota bacterium]
MLPGSRSPSTPREAWPCVARRDPQTVCPPGTGPARVTGRFWPTCASGRKSCAGSGSGAARRRAPLVLTAVGLLLLTALPADAQPPPNAGIPTVNDNSIGNLPQFLDTAINIVLSAGAQSTILGWGNDLARNIALILIVWTGARVALSGTFQAWELIKFIFVLAIPLALVRGYDTNIVGLGVSFPELITGQGNALMRLFGADVLAQGVATVMELAEDHMRLVGEEAGSVNLWTAFRTGGKQIAHLALLTAILGSFVLGMIVVLALAMAQILFAQAAIAVLVTLGPLFIPFMIVPKMDFLFWGWFKAMLQYSLYGAIAAAMVSLWTRIILGFARALEAETFEINSMTAATGVWVVPVFGVIVCAIVSIMKIGDIAGMIVGAGSDGGGFFGGAFMASRIVAAPARVAAAPLKGGVPA